MPWIPLYLTPKDAKRLLSWLNKEEPIAFISREKDKKLIARSSLPDLKDGRICIWHTLSGPLPWYREKKTLFRTKQWVEDVPDPWSGWDEELVAADGNPWFGNHVGVVWLNVRTKSQDTRDAIGMSGFEWIGNRYAAIGRKAPVSTEKWWRRLRGWVDRNSQRIPRSGPIDGHDKEIFAFSDAVKFIERGGSRDHNP